MSTKERYNELRQIYWEAGIWRKFSFEEFVKEAYRIIGKAENQQIALL